jgi:hypothetical protein
VFILRARRTEPDTSYFDLKKSARGGR